ncbi:unnamed protein product [Prunus armeniaca]
MKCVKEDVKNRFGGAAYSISGVNGEEFTWSTSLCSASSKSTPIIKSKRPNPNSTFEYEPTIVRVRHLTGVRHT